MKIIPGLIIDTKEINEELELNSFLTKNTDILKIESCKINGLLYFRNEELFLKSTISTKLVLASTVSLKPVSYDLEFPLELIFGSSSEADYVLNKEIDLDEIVFGHIVLEKPLKIYSDLDEELEEPDMKINHAFSELKDYGK